MQLIPLTRKRFSHWKVLKRVPSRNKHTMWLCRCDCGAIKEVHGTALKSGQSKSCGGAEHNSGTNSPTFKHGLSRTHEHRAWTHAKQRCFNRRNRKYRDYGGRGIRMCRAWRNNFLAFFAYVGKCPPGKSLDRIDNDGHYEPGNVRWATRSEQVRNRRCARILTQHSLH